MVVLATLGNFMRIRMKNSQLLYLHATGKNYEDVICERSLSQTVALLWQPSLTEKARPAGRDHRPAHSVAHPQLIAEPVAAASCNFFGITFFGLMAQPLICIE